MSGKKLTDALKAFDRDEFYTPSEALGIVKNLAKAGFDESVDVAVRLGVDPRKADQMVRGTVGLPAGTGKDVRVAVFATGEAAAEAREAGADIVGSDDLAAQVEAGQVRLRRGHRDARHDAARRPARPGPRAPRPDAQPEDGDRDDRRRPGGQEFKGGKVEYRTDRYGNIHVPLGKTSFEPLALETNFRAVIDELTGPSRRRPRAATCARSRCRPRWARRPRRRQPPPPGLVTAVAAPKVLSASRCDPDSPPEPRFVARDPCRRRFCAQTRSRSSSTAIAALRPLRPITLPAGCVAAPHR